MVSNADPFGNASSPTVAGISTAINETVNVLFNGKELNKIMVVGEVGIRLKDVTSAEPVHIRIESFEQLEKAAPNPAFLTAIHGKPGEYKLDLAALKATGTDTGTILKYQLHVAEAKKMQFLPLSVHAQWRCEDAQTSLMLHYATNPESRLATAASSDNPRLQNLSFVVGIAPSQVQSVMSKPSGVWGAESKKMQWNVENDLPLTAAAAEQQQQKILARFQVDAKSTPQPVGVRWSVQGETLSQLAIVVVNESSEAPSQFTIADTQRQCTAGKFLAGP